MRIKQPASALEK